MASAGNRSASRGTGQLHGEQVSFNSTALGWDVSVGTVPAGSMRVKMRNFVSKTRNFVFKMMNFAGGARLRSPAAPGLGDST